MKTLPTLAEFLTEAKFVRYKGRRRLWVRAFDQLLPVNCQFNGTLTEPPANILASLHANYFTKPDTFVADLDRNLRAIGAKS